MAEWVIHLERWSFLFFSFQLNLKSQSPNSENRDSLWLNWSEPSLEKRYRTRSSLENAEDHVKHFSEGNYRVYLKLPSVTYLHLTKEYPFHLAGQSWGDFQPLRPGDTDTSPGGRLSFPSSKGLSINSGINWPLCLCLLLANPDWRKAVLLPCWGLGGQWVFLCLWMNSCLSDELCHGNSWSVKNVILSHCLTENR